MFHFSCAVSVHEYTSVQQQKAAYSRGKSNARYRKWLEWNKTKADFYIYTYNVMSTYKRHTPAQFQFHKRNCCILKSHMFIHMCTHTKQGHTNKHAYKHIHTHTSLYLRFISLKINIWQLILEMVTVYFL